MKIDKEKTQELIDAYKKIKDFLTFLEKEKNANTKEEK